jgi:hypothetical protein
MKKKHSARDQISFLLIKKKPLPSKMNLCARLPHKSVQSSKRDENVERDLGVPPPKKNNVKKGAKNWGFCPPGNKEGGKCPINENALRRRKSRKIYMVEIFVFFSVKFILVIHINCLKLP